MAFTVKPVLTCPGAGSCQTSVIYLNCCDVLTAKHWMFIGICLYVLIFGETADTLYEHCWTRILVFVDVI